MDLLIFQAPILMVQASLDGILLGILFALIAYGMALQWGVTVSYTHLTLPTKA